MNKGKNNEVQSRRDFFKKVAKGALPILGAVVLSSVPVLAKAEPVSMGCHDDGCSHSCATSCARACRGKCNAVCQDSCYNNCSGSCKNSCMGSCKGSCRGSNKY